MTGEFKNAYPEAKLIAPAEVIDRLKDLKFDGGRIVLHVIFEFHSFVQQSLG